jgi:hypothetical protein
MIYFLKAAPASAISLNLLREQAGRAGYLIACGRGSTFSLIDARLHRPLIGLDHVTLAEIARAVEIIRGQ